MLNHILLIDDDRINNMINKRFINNYLPHAKVVVCMSGQEGLDYIEQHLHYLPDLIILDLNMPVMNGWDFLDIFLESGFSIPVKVLTSSIDEEDKIKIKEYPVVKNLFIKPLKKDMLESLLAL